MTLATQQRHLWEVVRGTRAVDGIDPLFLPTLNGALADRLTLYADMYRWRHLDAIRAGFPVFSRVVGTELEPLVGAYVRDCPSANPSLDHVGARLSAWLVAQGHDALADLVTFEQARAAVFDEEDVTPLLFAAFVARAAEAPGLRLALVPAWRVVRIEHALPPGNEGIPTLGHHLVWRRTHTVVDAPVSTEEAAALALIREGRTLGEACEAFATTPEPAQAAARVIGSWFAEGLVARID